MKKYRFSHSALQIVVASLMLGLTLPITVFVQCDECIDRRIYMFDASVDVPAPLDTAIQDIFKLELMLNSNVATRQLAWRINRLRFSPVELSYIKIIPTPSIQRQLSVL